MAKGIRGGTRRSLFARRKKKGKVGAPSYLFSVVVVRQRQQELGRPFAAASASKKFANPHFAVPTDLTPKGVQRLYRALPALSLSNRAGRRGVNAGLGSCVGNGADIGDVSAPFIVHDDCNTATNCANIEVSFGHGAVGLLLRSGEEVVVHGFKKGSAAETCAAIPLRHPRRGK